MMPDFNAPPIGQNLAGSNPAPSGDAGADAAGQGDSVSRSERRIQQLTAQKYELARSLDAQRSENAELARRLDALESRAQAPTPKPLLDRGWADLKDEELVQALQGDGVTPSDPMTVLRISREMARREVEAKIKVAKEELAADQERRSRVDSTWGRVIAEFGPEVQKLDSAIRQKAEALANTLVAEEGKDVFQRNPRLLYFVFAEADRQIRVSKASDASKELERLRALEKARLTGEEALAGAAESQASMKDLLAKGDIHGALMQTDLVRSMRGLPPKGAEGQ